MIPTFQGEVQLAGWRESHNSGATVTFWLPSSDDLNPFRGLTAKKGNTAGHRFACVLVEIGDDEQPVQPIQATPHPPNNLARRMMANGYFRNPGLWDRLDSLDIYTQAQHLKYIQSEPCCGQKTMGEAATVACNGDVILHHVRTAANSGTGIKPQHWYGIPVCHAHHNLIHRSATREDRDGMLRLAIGYTAEQVKAALKSHLGIESLAEITIEVLNGFERNAGLPITGES